MKKYNYTTEETIKAIQVYKNLWDILYELYNDYPENIYIDADNNITFGGNSDDSFSYSFPLELLTKRDPVYAIRNYIEDEIERKRIEEQQRREQLVKEAVLKLEQKEYENYLRLKEKYDKV